MIENKFAVIGLGQFGRAIAKALSMHGAEVLCIDINSEVVNSIADEVSLAVALDATDKKALLSQNIEDYDAVVVAIGQNFEQRLLCTSLLVDLNIRRIIARAIGKNQRIILEKIGVKEILSPEDEVGIVVAERLLNPSIVSYLKLPDGYRVAELKSPKAIAYRSLEDINLRDRYQLSLISIKNELEVRRGGKITFEQHIQGVPDSKTIVLPTDTLIVFGQTKDIDRFVRINS